MLQKKLVFLTHQKNVYDFIMVKNIYLKNLEKLFLINHDIISLLIQAMINILQQSYSMMVLILIQFVILMPYDYQLYNLNFLA